jgi:3-oxoacyl-[acyl-carrier protein] reductase/meso-butanediol dehydrogenase/(S,S)-butanediol dehydrogenase/diacetyl reductase
VGSLDGHKAIVTGGASGIGAAICERFVAEGARVAVLDRRVEGIEGPAFACDVANSAAVESATASAVDALGGLTDLVNNAGVGRNKPLHQYTDTDWALLLGVNLTGTFNCMRAVIPLLLEAGGGSIVNNASVNAVRPLSGEAPYSAAKAGVVNLTMTAALEYAPTIRVNCVSPGMIATALTSLVTSNPEWLAAAEKGTPLQRVGTADDVANVVAFLCSDAAAYITGQNFIIDGGATLPNAQAEALIAAIMSSNAQVESHRPEVTGRR